MLIDRVAGFSLDVSDVIAKNAQLIGGFKKGSRPCPPHHWLLAAGQPYEVLGTDA